MKDLKMKFQKSLCCGLILLGMGWTQTRPNIVLLLADDLGWADLGSYGSKFYETPNLDRLAQQGIRFTQAYAAAAVCSPTRSSIMTGKDPARTKNTDWFCNQTTGALPLTPYACQMDTAESTLAEALKAGGYKTLFTGKWHLGPSQAYWPERQGFDTNIGGWSGGHPTSYFSPYSNPKLKDGPIGEYLTDRLASETVKWIEKNQGSPFFVYHCFYQVHNPMQPKPALLSKYQTKAATFPFPNVPEFLPLPNGQTARNIQNQPNYAAMVQAMDDAVGVILAKLDQLNLSGKTYVFFMSDNGGLSTAEGQPTSNSPLKAGKAWLYEGGIREPFIVRGPGISAGVTTNQIMASTDLYPTLLELAGLPLRPTQHKDGISLSKLLRQGSALDRKALYWHYPHYWDGGGSRPASSIRMCDYKLIEYFENKSIELYNLNTDTGETTNLTANTALRPIRDLLLNRLHNWRDSVKANFPPGYVEPATPTLPAIQGCTRFGASNYNPCATVDDGSCLATSIIPGIRFGNMTVRRWKSGGILFLEWEGDADLRIQLVDSQGRSIPGISEGLKRMHFGPEQMGSGVYWLKVQSRKGVWSEKLAWIESP